MLAAYKKLARKIRSYEEAIGVLHWDLRTGAPKKAAQGRAEVIGVLSSEMFQLQTSEEMNQLLEQLFSQSDELTNVDRRSVVESKRAYDMTKKIPQALYEEYVRLTAEAESVWEEAKHEKNWAKFEPFLEKIVAMNKQFVTLWGYDAHPYDALLDLFEPGMTVAQIDPIFEQLRQVTVELLPKFNEVNHYDLSKILNQTLPTEQQLAFSRTILTDMGYDFDAGRLDFSAHPFATGLNLGDVRITTNVIPNDFTFALFSSIHEGGHALYEQNISPDLAGTPLCTGTSMGIHESQSRLWENQIGRSAAFWSHYLSKLNEAFDGAFEGVSQADFYKAINKVEPSLIRIEADELTYNLHIMIRYELEKALFDGSLAVKDLPEAWNNKYEAYLGVKPTHDGEGVLQDVHWAGGAFGYFPSYTLGNLYAAQFLHKLQLDHPNLNDRIAAGDLTVIQTWLKNHIHQFGKSKSPSELIVDVTGESLNPIYFITYLQEKFSALGGE
jgi:carboxypeptidase Taq